MSLKSAEFYCGGYGEYAAQAASGGESSWRIAALKSSAGPDLFLPFTVDQHMHSFTVGERRLGRVSTRCLRLANPWLAETHAPQDIARLLTHVLRQERIDLLDIGEIPEKSALRASLDQLAWPACKLRLGRKESVRWLVDLPDSFDAFLEGLPGKDPGKYSYKMRKLGKHFDVRFETFTKAADVERFLEEGERISRRTYQWNVGQQLRNDPATRDHFRALAEQGRLRCYLLSLDGTVRAFARGSIEGRIYHYDTPGFDPDFAKHSIGTIILLELMRDLIQNSDCKTFDFGTGGDETGFKSRFGNRRIGCNSYYVLNALRPRALLILWLQATLTGLKNTAARLIGTGAFRDRIKRRLRKYGD